MNRFRKLAAVVLSAATLMASSAVPAMAAAYTPALTGVDVTLHKYLVLDAEANVPNVTFEYGITQGTAVNGSTTALQVNAGYDADRVVGTISAIADVTYTPADTPVATPTPAEFTAPSGKQVIMKDITIPFSELEFKEPGVYRYILTETIGTAQGITYDTDGNGTGLGVSGKRTIDIYIEDDGNGALVWAGVVVYQGEVTDAPLRNPDPTTDPASKRPFYINEYTTYDLTFDKVVAGNQGSKDEYFQFTVTIDNAVAGTVYNVVGTFDTTTSLTGINTQQYTNPTSITVGANGSVSQVFWLQNNQNITIQGLATGSSYTIAEDFTTVTNEGYSVTATYDTTTGLDFKTEDGTANEAAIAISNGEVADSSLTSDAAVTFTNTKNGAVPTGVLVSATPVIIVGVVLLAGIAALVVVSSKRKAAEAAEAETDEN